jgi:hypothetical protein
MVVRSGLMVALLAVFAASCRGDLSLARVYYVPIGAETYVPVTSDSIVGERVCRLRTKDAGAVRDIISSAGPLGADARFSPQRIRVKIVETPDASGTAVFVDNEGVVARPEGYFHLSDADRQKLKRLIEHACQAM